MLRARIIDTLMAPRLDLLKIAVPPHWEGNSRGPKGPDYGCGAVSFNLQVFHLGRFVSRPAVVQLSENYGEWRTITCRHA